MPSEDKSPWANDRIRLVITDDCNINCFYCHNEGHAKGRTFLRRDIFSQLVRTIQFAGVLPKSVSIVGGEPLIHPELDQFISELKLVAGTVSITSNGITLTDNRLKALARAGCSRIRLGVDSLRQRRSRPSHVLVNPRPIVEIMDNIRDQGIDLELNVVLTQFNKEEISDFVETAGKIGSDIKFFEHVKVDHFAGAYSSAQIKTVPFVSFEEFDSAVMRSIPVDESFPDLAGANHVYHSGQIEVRYCRYLHPFGMCDRSGTRVGPNGYLTACMESREVVALLPGEPEELSLRKVQEANARRCSADYKVPDAVELQ